jgi:transaldolase
MKPTEELHNRGQSLWLDNITRGMLDGGDIKRYIDTHGVSGLTSNPSIFDSAIATGDYDESIKDAAGQGLTNEEIFYSLAVSDLQRAANLFAPIHERSSGVDGWVSLEVSPLLAYDTAKTVEAAKSLHARAQRDNLFIEIPGTSQGLLAIEECIASAVPINVTLLFDAEQYRAAADAYLRGIERRIASGLDATVACVASVFISRWDTAVAKLVPDALRNQLGLAVGQETYRAYRDVMESERFQRLENAGARMQRLLWASTKTKDPTAPDTLYVTGLAAPFTINTMPDSTLDAFFDHGEVGELLARDGGDCDDQLQRFATAGIDKHALARKLQDEGATSFAISWSDLLARIEAQSPTAKEAR